MAINPEYLNLMAKLQNNLYDYQKYGTMTRGHPFEGYDLHSMSLKDIEDMMAHLQEIYDQKTLHTPLWSPTRAQCNKHESIRYAHEELLVVKTLVGL